ncbi:MAG: hydrogenase formation protein HypD [Elusimicrobia bacterium]|nr:hydrogenase formation protein HypD [Elusimicrobiota bacterium]
MNRPITIMEVCGTHTMAIARQGLKKLFPPGVRMVSGPGCPVCVTPIADIDHAIEIAKIPDVIIATFGDMMRVPGSSTSLEAVKVAGSDIRVIYSPVDALEIATAHPDKKIVFIGVGFETTSPAIASTVMIARKKYITNFFVLPLFKTVPAALKTLMTADSEIDGFLLPGHVSAIIGMRPYEYIARDYGMPGVIAGFEAQDILRSVNRIVAMIRTKSPSIVNDYTRVVHAKGNLAAQRILAEVFTPNDSRWRAIGIIPDSGFGFTDKYHVFDAGKVFKVKLPPTREPKTCRCGAIMMGKMEPRQCPLFAEKCTPAHPIGPCMVSSEGVCAAEHTYGTL